MDVFENSGTPKNSILIGISIINHPFWSTPIFGNTQVLNVFVGCLMVIFYLFALKEGEASPTATEAPTEAWTCLWVNPPLGGSSHLVSG